MTTSATAEIKLTDNQRQLHDLMIGGPISMKEMHRLTGLAKPSIKSSADAMAGKGIEVYWAKEGRETTYWIEGSKPKRRSTTSRSRRTTASTATPRRQPRPRKKVVDPTVPAPGIELRVYHEGANPDLKTKGYFIGLVDDKTKAKYLARLECDIRNITNHTVVVLTHEIKGAKLMVQVMNDIDRPITLSLPAPKSVPASRKARTLL